jgi:hypothetical protein
MGGGGNVTINGVESGQGREEVQYEHATINRGWRKSCNNFLLRREAMIRYEQATINRGWRKSCKHFLLGL